MNTNDTCYGRVGTGTWTQEMYETSSRAAGRRTRELKKAGFDAYSSALGYQVTRVGMVKMTMVTIRHDANHIPAWPAKVENI